MKITVTRNSNGYTSNMDAVYKFTSAQTQAGMLAAIDPAQANVTDSQGRVIPKINSVLAGVPGLVLTSVSFDAVDGFTWKASLTYGTSTNDASLSGAQKVYPWDDDPVIETKPVDMFEATDKCYKSGDTQGNPTDMIRLPNGRPFATPPMVNIGAKRITLKWKSQHASDSACSVCEFTVNAQPFKADGRTYAPGTCYMENVTYGWAYTAEGIKYAEWDASVLYIAKGHNWKPVYMDYMAIILNDDADYKLAKVQIKDGVYGTYVDTKTAPYVTEPVLLDLEGRLLTSNAQDFNITPEIGDFQTNFFQNWSVLNIPVAKGKRR